MDTQSTVTSKTGVQKIGVKVTNELPKVKDQSINVRDKINDVLSTEKHNLVNYQIAVNEMINDDLRGVLVQNRNNLQCVHTTLFNEMFSMGEYQADAATVQQVSDIYDVFSNYKTQMPNS